MWAHLVQHFSLCDFEIAATVPKGNISINFFQSFWLPSILMAFSSAAVSISCMHRSQYLLKFCICDVMLTIQRVSAFINQTFLHILQNSFTVN